MERINQLKQFAAEEPDDPFNLYALALEYLKTDANEANKIFEKLTQTHPDYLPTYYPYAQSMVERKDFEKAEMIFQKGMEIARAKNDHKTLSEIQAAYNDWKWER